jgi:hypothetical protein
MAESTAVGAPLDAQPSFPDTVPEEAVVVVSDRRDGTRHDGQRPTGFSSTTRSPTSLSI